MDAVTFDETQAGRASITASRGFQRRDEPRCKDAAHVADCENRCVVAFEDTSEDYSLVTDLKVSKSGTTWSSVAVKHQSEVQKPKHGSGPESRKSSQ